MSEVFLNVSVWYRRSRRLFVVHCFFFAICKRAFFGSVYEYYAVKVRRLNVTSIEKSVGFPQIAYKVDKLRKRDRMWKLPVGFRRKDAVDNLKQGKLELEARKVYVKYLGRCRSPLRWFSSYPLAPVSAIRAEPSPIFLSY